MTLSEATKLQIYRLSRSEWNEYAHIELAHIGEKHGPWVTARDVSSFPNGKNEMQILWLEVKKDDWVEWVPPDDVDRFISSWPTWGNQGTGK